MVVETNGRALVEAVRGIPGRVHVCLEEGTQSAWLYELLKPHVAEIVVAVAPEKKGAKDDRRDAWARADELRTGCDRDAGVQGTGAPGGTAQRGTGVRLRGHGRGAGEEPPEGGVSCREASGRTLACTTRRSARRVAEEAAARRTGELAEWLGRQLDQLEPLREEAEELAARGGEDAPDHPEAVDGARAWARSGRRRWWRSW